MFNTFHFQESSVQTQREIFKSEYELKKGSRTTSSNSESLESTKVLLHSEN